MFDTNAVISNTINTYTMKYFLLGAEAISDYCNPEIGGIDAVIRADEYYWKVVKSNPEDPEQLLSDCKGYQTWQQITEQEFKFLSQDDLIIDRDGYAWKVIKEDQAKAIIEHNIDLEVCQMYEDNAQSMIQDMDELEEAINHGNTLTISVGFVQFIKED